MVPSVMLIFFRFIFIWLQGWWQVDSSFSAHIALVVQYAMADELDAGGLGDLGLASEQDAMQIADPYLRLQALTHPSNMAIAMPSGAVAAFITHGGIHGNSVNYGS